MVSLRSLNNNCARSAPKDEIRSSNYVVIIECEGRNGRCKDGESGSFVREETSRNKTKSRAGRDQHYTSWRDRGRDRQGGTSDRHVDDGKRSLQATSDDGVLGNSIETSDHGAGAQTAMEKEVTLDPKAQLPDEADEAKALDVNCAIVDNQPDDLCRLWKRLQDYNVALCPSFSEKSRRMLKIFSIWSSSERKRMC